jgi:ABC-type glycerol-3-phosphate transport system substrate-binding protein
MPSQGLAVRVLGTAALAVVALGARAGAAAELELWSHWADHETKVAFVEEAVRRF